MVEFKAGSCSSRVGRAVMVVHVGSHASQLLYISWLSSSTAPCYWVLLLYHLLILKLAHVILTTKVDVQPNRAVVAFMSH